MLDTWLKLRQKDFEWRYFIPHEATRVCHSSRTRIGPISVREFSGARAGFAMP